MTLLFVLFFCYLLAAFVNPFSGIRAFINLEISHFYFLDLSDVSDT